MAKLVKLRKLPSCFDDARGEHRALKFFNTPFSKKEVVRGQVESNHGGSRVIVRPGRCGEDAPGLEAIRGRLQGSCIFKSVPKVHLV